jgi:hypothetical protein
VRDDFCHRGGCCRSCFLLKLVNKGTRKKTDAEIELHTQSCKELETEWNGYVLSSVSLRPMRDEGLLTKWQCRTQPNSRTMQAVRSTDQVAVQDPDAYFFDWEVIQVISYCFFMVEDPSLF